MPRPPGLRRASLLSALILLLLYGAALRLDAYTSGYGRLGRPAWAAALSDALASAGRQLRPYDLGWAPEARPYEGGDPINYLRYAREMESFYQAHVREPVFLASTRAYLWLLGGQDAAVSFASMTGSLLAIAGTFLLGCRLMPLPAAFAAALGVAIDYEVVSWSTGGWRDDTFMAGVLWTAWALLRTREAPTPGRAVVLGLCAGAACLTRITALTFVLPGILLVALDRSPPPRRDRTRAAVLALAVGAAVVAPYLVNCAIRLGDPLIAVNYHTVYYRHREGSAYEGRMTAGEYVAGKFRQRPIAAADTAFMGIAVQPFVTKWNGLHAVLGASYRAVVWLSIAGLMLLPFTPGGRLLLVVLVTSLAPYAMTWNIGGGDAWRFTMHAYPLYLLAAAYAAASAARAAVHLLRGGPESAATWRRPGRGVVAGAFLVILAAAAVPFAHFGLPWLTVREALAQGEDVSILTGERDGVFYRSGWSVPHHDGVTFRVSEAERATVHLPLPARAPYDLIVRADPVAPGVQEQLTVLFNGHLVARVPLTWDPQRMGSHRIALRPNVVRAGRNQVTLIPDILFPAGRAGPAFAWLPADRRLGVRVWYLRVLARPQR